MADPVGVAGKAAEKRGAGAAPSGGDTAVVRAAPVRKAAAPVRKKVAAAAGESTTATPVRRSPTARSASGGAATGAGNVKKAVAGSAASGKVAASAKKPAVTRGAAASDAAVSSGTTAPKKSRQAAARASGDPVQAPPTAARFAAKGATMAKPADTKMRTGGESVTKGARSAKETERIRAALAGRRDELRAEYDQTLSEITELQRDRLTDSAGDDQADTGTKTFEREQEISLANGILERITQVERALERLDEGGYGWCERCGNPIPVERLAAFPSATLCVSCKQLEERR